MIISPDMTKTRGYVGPASGEGERSEEGGRLGKQERRNLGFEDGASMQARPRGGDRVEGRRWGLTLSTL